MAIMNVDNGDKLLITKGEITEMEDRVAKSPTRYGTIIEAAIRVFLSHLSQRYGIDLDVETESMRNDRIKKANIELKRSSKLGRGKSGDDDDDW